MISKTIFTVPFAALVLLGGCADPRVGPNSKTGWVTELYTPAKLQANHSGCLKNLSDEQLASHQYVEITTPHLRSYRYISAMVPEAIKLHLHDKVEFSPPSCKDGAVPEVVQILKHSH